LSSSRLSKLPAACACVPNGSRLDDFCTFLVVPALGRTTFVPNSASGLSSRRLFFQNRPDGSRFADFRTFLAFRRAVLPTKGQNSPFGEPSRALESRFPKFVWRKLAYFQSLPAKPLFPSLNERRPVAITQLPLGPTRAVAVRRDQFRRADARGAWKIFPDD
jgi:hypothetical protein